MSRSKRGHKDTIAGLAIGVGVVGLISIIEARRSRTTAPVVTRGGRIDIIGGDPKTLLTQIAGTLSHYEARARAWKEGRK